MRCPTLSDLPPPPLGKIGWPWTVETSPVPAARGEETPWPRISIVTPSYDQGQFLEETIRSVLLQGYPNLEYIVIDGGAADQSVEIIKKYEPWLAYWVSEKDRGQAHAINKGFCRSTGVLLGWLNSDDVLLPGALSTVAVASRSPNERVLIAGRAEYRDDSGTRSIWVVNRLPQTFAEVYSYFDTYFAQPSVFFTRKALRCAGALREDLHYAMDLDLWLRIAGEVRITLVEQHLSWMRQHNDAKTWRDTLCVIDEVERVLQPHSRHVSPEIVRRTFALARRNRSRAWVAAGLSSLTSGDRKNAWLAAYLAARAQMRTLGSRGWVKLVVQLALPRPVSRLLFGVRVAD
jgi:glycosyltransferase involved in cell wall biosynthesis